MRTALRIRACEARDLAHFGRFGSPGHLRYCRDEFARGDAVLILVATDDHDEPIGKLHVDLEAKADDGVEDHNPRARLLYERLGYEVVGTSQFEYPGAPDPNPGVLMRKAVA